MFTKDDNDLYNSALLVVLSDKIEKPLVPLRYIDSGGQAAIDVHYVGFNKSNQRHAQRKLEFSKSIILPRVYIIHQNIAKVKNDNHIVSIVPLRFLDLFFTTHIYIY